MNLQIILRGVVLAMVSAALLSITPVDMHGKTKEKKKGDGSSEQGTGSDEAKDGGSSIQRIPAGVFENLQNKVSNLEFYSTNYGIFGLNIRGSAAGGIWPRGSRNAYIFGGGIWFGAKKWLRGRADVPDSLKPLSVISYNPNSGASWMSPGRITEPLKNSLIDQSLEGINKYRIYFSTDYNKFTGEPFDRADIQSGGPSWPIWDTSPGDTLKVDRYLGHYVDEVSERNRLNYTKGPAVISGEDIFTTYKDTDLSRYEIGRRLALEQGYPLGIQVEQTIYSWGFGQYQDFIYIRYLIINKSQDTLSDCFMAPAMDMDIGDAGNDRTKILIPEEQDDTLNLAIQWSESEATRYGYIGFDFLESPAVTPQGYIRKDKKFYSEEEQVGLHAFRNWILQIDPQTPEERYNFMADQNRDEDSGPGDKRFLMSTGPFTMLPGDTARVVVGVMFAFGKNNTPTGQYADLEALLGLNAFAQKVYDENFLAPVPPDPANVSWKPLDNAIELTWDEQSERSLDLVEDGLDFAGYIIQRSRQAVSQIEQADSVVGWNIGWKTVARYDLPSIPDSVTRIIAARTSNLRLLGPWWRLPMLADTIPGLPAVTGNYIIRRVDTLKRPGLPDQIVVSADSIGLGVFANLGFDPYDDKNDDSTFFNTYMNGKYVNEAIYGTRFVNTSIRDVVREAIVQVMDSITGGHRHIDVGDDNNNSQVDENSANLVANEKLLNNVDYYYRVLSFDGGSQVENTGPKLNSGIAGINEVRTAPEAPAAGFPITPEIVSADGLGGIHNFNMLVYDAQRLGQLFGGDTLEFEFQPFRLYDPAGGRLFFPYWHASEVIVRSKKQGTELMRFAVDYERNLSDRANNYLRNLDSSFISRFTYFDRDTVITDIDSGEEKDTVVVDSVYTDNRGVRVAYTGSFVSQPNLPIYNTLNTYKATFGVRFDYSMLQFGDSLRFGKFGDTALPYKQPLEPFAITAGDANTGLVAGTQTVGEVLTTVQSNGSRAIVSIDPIPDVGQVKLEVEFAPGGTENLRYKKNNQPDEYVFDNVNYLTMKVKNIASYTREIFDAQGQRQEETVQYDFSFTEDSQARIIADTSSEATLSGRLAKYIQPGKFAIYAYDWVNVEGLSESDRERSINRAQRQPSRRPIGTANRYYTGVNQGTRAGAPTNIRFTHTLLVNGAEVIVDYAGMGAARATPFNVNDVLAEQPSRDFEPGDKFTVEFTGGALGLPEPGGKVLIAIPDPKPAAGQYTDDLLDQIRVVPNPYLVDHVGQTSSGNKVLFFTHLPDECKIEIFTAAGELLTTIDHTSTDNPDGKVAVNAWDLLTRSRRQVQSQLLIARITTPNGAETIKEFSVIVGGFRILTQ